MIIYILKLESNKYYVGRTVNINFRLDQHFNTAGSYWTMKYKPIEILKLIPNANSFDEDKYTFIMMAKHGIDNVRGGSFTRITLPVTEKMLLQKIINNAIDICFNCHIMDHYAHECPYDPIKNDHIAYIRNKIMDYCVEIDKDKTGLIDLDTFCYVLQISDSCIFKDINRSDLVKIYNRINRMSIRGINEIDINNINYIDAIIGLSVFCDSKFHIIV